MILNSIQELTSISGTSDIEKCTVLGYYFPYDGGGGVFSWSSESEDLDDGGLVFRADDVSIGRWIRLFNGDIDVRWFGVRGDEVEDDTNTLQRCFDSCRKHKLKSSLPNTGNRYRITGNVNIYTSVDFQAVLLLDGSNARITIATSEEPITMIDSEVEALMPQLTKGSSKVNILNKKNASVLIRSSADVMINRYNGGPVTPYYKRQLILISDEEGNFNSELQWSYLPELYKDLIIRIFPYESPINIDNLHIEIDNMHLNTTPLVTNRSRVTFNNLSVVNGDDPSRGYVGVHCITGYGIVFNRPRVTGFNDYNGGSHSLGYGITTTDCYETTINDPQIADCKHAIMAGYQTNMYIKGGVLTGIAIGEPALQPLDAHWCYGFYVEGVKIYSKNGSHTGISAAGKDIEIRRCEIYNCWSIGGMSATTPEIDGKWICEDNYIEFSNNASYLYFLGMFSSGLNYGNTFTRTLYMPEYISIQRNMYVNKNIGKHFFAYRGNVTVIPKRIVQRFEIVNNFGRGEGINSLVNRNLLVIRAPYISDTYYPKIIVRDQEFEPYAVGNEGDLKYTVFITSRFKNGNDEALAPVNFVYDVFFENCTGITTSVDVDACERFVISNCDVLATNGGQINQSNETKVPSFEYTIIGCTIGKSLAKSGLSSHLCLGSAKVKLFNSIIFSNYKLTGSSSGSIGPVQFTNFNDGIVAANGNKVVKDSQFDNNGNPITPLFPTNNWASNALFYRSDDLMVYNYGFAMPVIGVDILNNRAQIVRTNDNSISLFVNNGKELFDPISWRVVSLSTDANILPRRQNQLFVAVGNTTKTFTVQASNYVDKSYPLLFRNNGGGTLNIIEGEDVFIVGTPYVLNEGEMLGIIQMSSNNYVIYQRQ